MAGSSYSIVGRRAGYSRTAEHPPTNDMGEPAPSTCRAGRTLNPYCLAQSPVVIDLSGIDGNAVGEPRPGSRPLGVTLLDVLDHEPGVGDDCGDVAREVAAVGEPSL